MRVALRLVLARLRARPGRALLVVVGIAIASGFVLTVAASSTVAGDASLRAALRRVPEADRAFVISSGGIPPGFDYRQADAAVTPILRQLAPDEPPLRVLLYGELNIGGPLRVGAIDGLAQWVRVDAGRLPTSCTPTRCEALRIGGSGGSTGSSGPSAYPDIGVVVVGTASLRSTLPFGGAFKTPAGQPLVLVDGVAAATAIERLSSFPRQDGWIAPLPTAGATTASMAALLARAARAAGQVTAAGGQLSAPTEAVAGARVAARTAGRRLQLVGGQAAALVAGFVLLAAVGFRRDLEDERLRLVLRGARRQHELAFVAIETGLVAIVGVLAGIVAAAVAAGAVADAAGVSTGAVLRHALLDAGGLRLVVLCLLGSWLALLAVGFAPAGQRERGFGVLDAAAIGAVAIAALAAARGATSAASLANTDDPLLALMPVLLAIAAGLAVARVLPAVLRPLARRAASLPLAPRLAVVALGRAGALPATAAGFLAVAVGLGVFSAVYRATLADGIRAQAAYAVPLDLTVHEGPALVRPFEAASTGRYASLGADAYPVLRRPATIATAAAQSLELSLLGVPGAALPRIAHWQGSFGGDRAALGRRLAWHGAADLAGLTVPAGATALEVDARTAGPAVELHLIVGQADGSFDDLLLGDADEQQRHLAVRLAAADAGGRVVGVRAIEPQLAQKTDTHSTGEGNGQVSATGGTLALGALAARTAAGPVPIGSIGAWHGPAGFTLVADPTAAGGVRLTYVLDRGASGLVRPDQPADTAILPALVDPGTAALAAADGSLVVRVDDQPVRLRVIGTAARFPTLTGPFLVVDETALRLALDGPSPGSGVPDEAWLAARGPGGPAALAALSTRAPLDALTTTSRAALTADLEGDPLARATLATLAAAALVALALAAAGVLVVISSDLRDERRDLYDLETAGVAPRSLRWTLRLRALMLLVGGAIGGIVLGLALARSVVATVQVTAGAAQPEPPLLTVVPWLLIVAALVALLLVVTGLTLLATARAFGEDVPARPVGVTT